MSEKKSGAVGRQYHLAVVEKKDREIDALAAEVRRLRAMLEPTPDARELADRWWCLEGCGFVDKDHRCEQWCQTVRIPKEAQARLLDEAAEREPPRVCGNCKHGEPTSLDPMRCYKATPYIPTGIRCNACNDWEPCYTRDNPRAAIKGAK